MKIVVKIEIWMLTSSDGRIDPEKMDRLALVLSNLNNSGRNVVIVSSGAIALGQKKLNLPREPESFTEKQAVAAIGQAELIKTYQQYFSEYNQTVAQVLLTKDVVKNTVRKKNATSTIDRLLEMGIIPVVNENDTVSTEDIVLDDNYPLTLKVAEIVESKIILVKSMDARKYIIVRKGNKVQVKVDEKDLFEELELTEAYADKKEQSDFPEKIMN